MSKKFQQGLHIVNISPESVTPGVYYTFNMNPTYQPDMGKLNGFHEGLSHTYKQIVKLSNCDIKVVPEISRKGRLHYHGYIKIYNVLDFYLKDLQALMGMGSLEIDTIADPSEWGLYVFKQKELMNEYVTKHSKYPYIYNTKDIKQAAQKNKHNSTFE